MKKVYQNANRIKVYVPILFALLVIGVIAWSLTGYEKPVYAVDAPEQTAEEQAPDPGKTVKKPKKLALRTTDAVRTKVPAASPVSVKKVAEESGTYEDGTYYGSSRGFGGKLTVCVKIKDGKIAKITIVENSETPSYLAKAKMIIPAMVKKQTTNVDAVSGATYSSNGIIGAVRNALKKAVKADDKKSSKKDKKESEKNKKKKAKKTKKKQKKTTGQRTTVKPQKKGNFPYPDGTYEGTARGFRSKITVAVTIKNGTITAVEVVSHGDDPDFFEKALDVLKNIVRKQTTDVDTVSGATFSSKGLRKAVENALEQAKKAAEEEEKKNSSEGGKPGQEKPGNQKDPGKDPGNKDDGEDDGGENPPVDPKPEEPSPYADGTYSVTAMVYADDNEDFVDYEITASVTIENGKIVAISDVTGDGNPTNQIYLSLAEEEISGAVLAKGSPDGVDTVSGATCSSNALLDACRAALKQARTQ